MPSRAGAARRRELVACACELGRERFERSDRALGARGERRSALALLGRQRLRGRGRPVDELFERGGSRSRSRAQLGLGSRLEPLGVLDERPQLGEPFRRRAALAAVSSCRFRAAASSRHAVAARARRGVVAGECVEQVELVRRPCEPALLELAGHRDRLLGGRRHVLARRRAAPGVGARAAVREDPPREHETRLLRRSQLRERLVRLSVELGLDVGLLAGRTDHRRVSTRAEQEPDRLCEDRLSRAGLACDRVQARSEVELGLADEDEILDAQPAKHG